MEKKDFGVDIKDISLKNKKTDLGDIASALRDNLKKRKQQQKSRVLHGAKDTVEQSKKLGDKSAREF